MGRRLRRKEIKRDEFVATVGRTVEYAERHVWIVIGTVVALVVLGGLGWGGYIYLGHRAEKANQALVQAIRVYGAPVVGEGADPDHPRRPTYSSVEERRRRARELFESLREEYRWTDAADVALVYLGNITLSEGDRQAARELWETFLEEQKKTALAAQVRLNLLQLDRLEGKTEEVVASLRGMLEEPEPPLPIDLLLYELGVTLEELGRTDEAAAAYQRLVDEFPRSPYVAQAQGRATALSTLAAVS